MDKELEEFAEDGAFDDTFDELDLDE